MAATRSCWQVLAANVFVRDLILVMALKAALIVALYVLLFRAAVHPSNDPAATATAIAGTNASTPNEVRR